MKFLSENHLTLELDDSKEMTEYPYFYKNKGLK